MCATFRQLIGSISVETDFPTVAGQIESFSGLKMDKNVVSDIRCLRFATEEQ